MTIAHRVRRAEQGMLALAVLLATSAAGQTSRPAQRPPTTAPAVSPLPTSLLSGPRVTEDDVDPSQPTFGDERQGRRTIKVPPARWIEIYLGLDLDDAQRGRAETRARAYQRTLRAFQREKRPEIRALRRSINEAVDAPPRELRERLRKLESERPSPVETQKSLWKLLSPAQRDEFRTRLDEEKRRTAEAARERRDRREQGMSEREGSAESDAVTRRRLRFLKSRKSRGGG